MADFACSPYSFPTFSEWPDAITVSFESSADTIIIFCGLKENKVMAAIETNKKALANFNFLAPFLIIFFKKSLL
jgi:hypothetical protein